MARPQKQTVDYFPHDAGAATGDTLTALQGQFGNDGYAFWFKLLEKLASSEGHFIDCSNSKKWQVILGRAQVDEDTGKKIMVLLVEMQAIDKELWENRSIIWCQNLVDNLATVYQNRRREIPQKPFPNQQLQPKLDLALRTKIPTGDNLIPTTDNSIPTGENTQSKVKESKLNESKVKETNKLLPSNNLTIENVLDSYKKNISLSEELSEDMEKELEGATKRFSATWVVDAIHVSCNMDSYDKPTRTWRYIAGILKNWERYGKEASQVPLVGRVG